MDSKPPSPAQSVLKSRLALWLALAAIGLVVALFVFGRNSNLVDPEGLQTAITTFADGPWGGPALILTFCACAFIGVPQFVLISIGVYAFGPLWGAVWSWTATMVSGSLTFWLGRFFGEATLARLGEGRVKRFTRFIAKNAFAASAIVRNAPAGPFVMVNMVFGAVRAPYLHYAGGMALGIVPKIAVITFGMQAIQAALGGNLIVAAGAAIASLLLIVGGYLYVRQRQRKGKNIALGSD